MDVTLILGPTGVGKTARSVQLARSLGAPVVALDRVQCAPQLAIGSARPHPDELAGTRRIYLACRDLADGILPGAEAADRLERLMKEKADTTPSLILEGGSLSILSELLGKTSWAHGHRLRVEVLLESSPRQYESALAGRVAAMLGYTGSSLTIQREVAETWPAAEARQHLLSVIGYSDIIAQCTHHGIDPASLSGPSGRALRYNLADPILQSHLNYARKQRAQFASALPRLAQAGAHVELING